MIESAGFAPQLGFFFTFRGRGYVIALITAGCLVLADWACGLHYHDTEYYSQHGWPKLAAFVLSGMIVWWLDNLGQEERLDVDGHAAVRRTFFREQDSLLFVRARYWPLMLLALGGVFYFIRD